MEPWFRYYHFQSDVNGLIDKTYSHLLLEHTFTSFDHHPDNEFFACGTSKGDVVIFDPNGNCRCVLKTSNWHKGAVISLKVTSDYCISASPECVVAHPLYPDVAKKEGITHIPHPEKITTITLDDLQSTISAWTYIAGHIDGSVTRVVGERVKGKVRHRSSVVQGTEACRCPVHAICDLVGDRMVVVSDIGTMLVDVSGKTYSHVPPVRGTVPWDVGHASIASTAASNTHAAIVAVGWGTIVSVMSVDTRGAAPRLTPMREFNIGETVLGVAWRGDDLIVLSTDGSGYLAVRGVEPMEPRELLSDRLDVDMTLDMSSTTILPVRHKDPSGRPQTRFAVFTRRQILRVVPFTLRDRALYLERAGRLSEAVEVAQQVRDVALQVRLGTAFLRGEVENGRIASVKAVAAVVLRKSSKAWADFIFAACRSTQLAEIVPLIPPAGVRLHSEVYFAVIGALIGTGQFDVLASTINRFLLADVIQAKHLLPVLREALTKNPTDVDLHEAIASAHHHLGDFESACTTYIQAKSPKIFDYIERNRQFGVMAGDSQNVNHINELIRIDPGRAITLFAAHPDALPARLVRDQLSTNGPILFKYLEALARRSTSLVIPFSDRMVELYAEYGTEDGLQTFLFSRLGDINHQAALNVCTTHKLHHAARTIYLHTGQFIDALRLSVMELGSVELAAEALDMARVSASAAQHESLTLLFLELVQANQLVGELLDLYRIRNDLPLLQIVKDIDVDSTIPNLADRLKAVLGFEFLNVSLLSDCDAVFHADVLCLLADLRAQQRRGQVVHVNAPCSAPGCAADIAGTTDGLVVFGCGHTYHGACLSRLGGESTCPACGSVNTGG